MGNEITRIGQRPDGRDLYTVEPISGPAFDAAVLEFLRKWTQRYPHELSLRVLQRADLAPGRSLALVLNGTPLITRQQGCEQADWDFYSWADGSPSPIEGELPVSLSGRIRWWARFDDPRDPRYFHHPVDEWVKIVQRFLAADRRHRALFESTFNRTGMSSEPENDTNIVTYHGQVMHLVTPDSTADEIERAWLAAQGYSAGEKIGYLTSLPADERLSVGDEVSDDTLQSLASQVQGIGFEAFDGSGMLIWRVGEQSHTWVDVEKED